MLNHYSKTTEFFFFGTSGLLWPQGGGGCHQKFLSILQMDTDGCEVGVLDFSYFGRPHLLCLLIIMKLGLKNNNN